MKAGGQYMGHVEVHTHPIRLWRMIKNVYDADQTNVRVDTKKGK
jgi:hypothetical protein